MGIGTMVSATESGRYTSCRIRWREAFRWGGFEIRNPWMSEKANLPHRPLLVPSGGLRVEPVISRGPISGIPGPGI